MGKKSRRRPATRNKATEGQQVETEEEEALPPPDERPPSIHKLDDLEAAVAWMKKGRVDTKGFAKYLPHTAQALQEREVTPEEVTRDLEDVYSVTTCRFSGCEVTPMKAIARLSAMAALPEKFFKSERQSVVITGLFSDELEAKLIEGNMTHMEADDSLILLKESVDELCRKRAPRLDRELFHGRRGTFLKRCPLYGIAPEEYGNDGMPMDNFASGLDYDYEDDKESVAELRQESIFSAAKNVANGFHEISQTCWECKTVCQDLKSCAKCQAAQYCSKECQRSAWKQGHKHKCELLGAKYAALDESLKAMDEYHSSSNDNYFKRNGLSLNSEIDFEVLEIGFRVGLAGIGIEWGPPSMRLFYENLEKVTRGEMWFFPINTSESRYREADLDKEREHGYFRLLCQALCYDYDMVVSSGFVVGGVAMPVSVFQDWYFQRGETTIQKENDRASDRFRMRRECKRHILQELMENDHT